MKDNLDIDKLFKDKFENFEGDVNPQLWENISQGISTSGATTTGLTLGVKALIAGAAVVTIGVATFYLGGFNEQPTIANNNTTQTNEVETVKGNDHVIENKTPEIIATDENDPVINENKDEIIKSLNTHTVVYNDETQSTELVEQTNTQSSDNSNITTTVETEKSIVETTVEKTDNETHQNDVVEKETTNELVYPKGKIEYEEINNIFQYAFKSNAFDAEKLTWDFGDGNLSTDENPKHTYQKAGEYKVVLTLVSKDNEVYQESKIIEIKTSSSIDNIPNVITPNGDRINDEFVIKTTDLKTFSIQITDKYGQTIFKSNDPNFSWDGTDLSGNVVEKDMYIYYILATGNDGATYKIPGQLYVR